MKLTNTQVKNAKPYFITAYNQVQTKDGWIPLPLDSALHKGDDKLRSTPIRLLFNEPDLNLRAEYSLFDRTSGRPLRG